MSMTPEKIQEIAENYTKAWCSHVPDMIASFYTEDGRIIINGGTLQLAELK